MTEKHLPLEEYLQYIERYEIPPYPCALAFAEEYMSYIRARTSVTKRGLWVQINMEYVKRLATALQGQRVLEVMAGGGWLAKGLSECGIHIFCTDNYSWAKQHPDMKHLYKITKIKAVNAVKKYGDKYDVLLVSWPPYGDHTIIDVAAEWGNKPIVYIGESNGGCNAPEEFWGHFHVTNTIRTPQWDGLHDSTYIGVYNKKGE